MQKTHDLYIDVDGVLFAIYDGYLQLRPNVTGFLAFCIKHFNCFWLTAWDEDRLNQFFIRGYAGNQFRAIKHIKWPGNNKAQSINFDRPFLWIEDGISDEERQTLVDHKAWENFIHVNDKGRDELYQLMVTLALRIGISIE